MIFLAFKVGSESRIKRYSLNLIDNVLGPITKRLKWFNWSTFLCMQLYLKPVKTQLLQYGLTLDLMLFKLFIIE